MESDSLPEMSASTPRWLLLLAAAIATGFTVGVLAMDAYFAQMAVRQYVAGRTWKPVQATVVDVTVRRDTRVRRGSGVGGRQTRYLPRVTYSYRVGEREYVSDRASVGGWTQSAYSKESDALAENPKGSTVTAYYNPADPASAALQVGVQPEAAMIGVILLCFNGALLYIVAVVARSMRARRRPIEMFLIHDDPIAAVLRLTSFSALEAFALTVAIAGFCGIFVVVLLASPAAAPTAAAVVFGSAVGLAALAFAIRLRMLSSGRYDIVIDRTLGRVVLPRRRGEREGPLLRVGEIRRVEVMVDPDRIKDRRMTRRILIHSEVFAEPREIARWLSAGHARVLASWLRREIRVASEQDADDD